MSMSFLAPTARKYANTLTPDMRLTPIIAAVSVLLNPSVTTCRAYGLRVTDEDQEDERLRERHRKRRGREQPRGAHDEHFVRAHDDQQEKQELRGAEAQDAPQVARGLRVAPPGEAIVQLPARNEEDRGAEGRLREMDKQVDEHVMPGREAGVSEAIIQYPRSRREHHLVGEEVPHGPLAALLGRQRHEQIGAARQLGEARRHELDRCPHLVHFQHIRVGIVAEVGRHRGHDPRERVPCGEEDAYVARPAEMPQRLVGRLLSWDRRAEW